MSVVALSATCPSHIRHSDWGGGTEGADGHDAGRFLAHTPANVGEQGDSLLEGQVHPPRQPGPQVLHSRIQSDMIRPGTSLRNHPRHHNHLITPVGA